MIWAKQWQLLNANKDPSPELERVLADYTGAMVDVYNSEVRLYKKETFFGG